jgi:hypothetical protein
MVTRGWALGDLLDETMVPPPRNMGFSISRLSDNFYLIYRRT